MRYALVERVIGHRDEVELSEEQFHGIGTSLSRTQDLLYIEEKYFLLLQNYFELERSFHDLALSNLLFSDFDRSDQLDDINLVNRHLANMLSATRMYVDHVPQHLNAIFGANSAECKAFTQATNQEYDVVLGYRLLYALRNHAQHSDFPVHSLSYGINWINHTGKRMCRHSVTAYLHADEVGESKGFKSVMLAELKTLGEKIDLKPMVRQSLASFARIHTLVRKACADTATSEGAALESAVSMFERKTNRAPVGLAAVQIEDDGSHAASHSVHLGNVHRRRHLERRSNAITNLQDHFVSGDIE